MFQWMVSDGLCFTLMVQDLFWMVSDLLSEIELIVCHSSLDIIDIRPIFVGKSFRQFFIGQAWSFTGNLTHFVGSLAHLVRSLTFFIETTSPRFIGTIHIINSRLANTALIVTLPVLSPGFK